MTPSYPSSPREILSPEVSKTACKARTCNIHMATQKKNGMNCMSAGSEQAMPSCQKHTMNAILIAWFQTHQCKHKALNSNYVEVFSWRSNIFKIQKRTCTRTSNVDPSTRRNVLDKFAGIIILHCSLHLELAKYKAIVKWNFQDIECFDSSNIHDKWTSMTNGHPKAKDCRHQ